MRHHQAVRKLGRVGRQRSALLSGLARSLIIHGRITTTEAKAKEMRPFVERLITKGKSDTLVHRRLVAARLGGDQAAVQKLFADIAPKYTKRSGGYTRITRLGARAGDAAELALIELV